MNLSEILQSKEVQRFSGSDAELFKFVKKLAHENVGHGISPEYWATRFEFGGLINQSNIGCVVKNAKYHRGAFAKRKMLNGCKIYWAKRHAAEAMRKKLEGENNG